MVTDSSKQVRRWWQRVFFMIIVVLVYCVGGEGRAQLTWGIGGNGGNGSWDTTTANWWNGSTNVSWVAGGAAIFSGTAGMVFTSSPSVSSITFDTAGYLLYGGYLSIPSSGLTVTANQSAVISASFNNSGSRTFVKKGAALLTVSGTALGGGISTLRVDEGELRVTGNLINPVTNSITLGQNSGAVLTLGQSTQLRSLSGGGIVRPVDQAQTITVTMGGTYGGIFQDNGNGRLALSVFTATLTGISTHSGPTTVAASLTFRDNGSALNSPMNVFMTLQLDNSAIPLASRISDSLDFTLEKGKFDFIGHSTVDLEEKMGPLILSSASTISVNQPDTAAALVTFASATRQNHATINFTGSGRAKWNGLTNDAAGIVGSYATFDNEWAKVGADGRAEALASYASDINTAVPGDHVKITGGGTVTLAGSGTRATLNFQNDSGNVGALDLGAGHVLTLGDGGILSSGGGTGRIQGGTLKSATDELVVTNRNAFTIDSNIGETSAGTGLTKSGAGILTLTGNNSYSGRVVVNEGTLAVSSDANLGTGSEIDLNGGKLLAAGSFSSTKSITNQTTRTATIDTAEFDLVFSGPSSGLTKQGTGSLTFNHAAIGKMTVAQGTLVLPDATSGDLTLNGGTLQVSGALSSLTGLNAATLDIGGERAVSLTVNSSVTVGGHALTVRFDLGADGSDLWTLAFPFNASLNDLFFEFHDLGGIATGTNYPLLNFQPGTSQPQLSLFHVSPASISTGWSGTFSMSSNAVSVTFTSLPEPGSVALLAFGGILLGHRRSRRPSRSGNGCGCAG
jgi:autotransporter-associated beta strand protein